MKRSCLVGALVLAAACGESKKAPPKPEPAAGPSPAEQERALARAAEAVEAATAQANAAKAAAEAEAARKQEEEVAKARAAALDEARNVGVLGAVALQQGGNFATITGTGDITSGFDDADVMGGLLGNEAGEMQGGFGFGRSGFGPGGGGTGVGTIGTGRYGTLGHGSGTGSGYGVGGGRGGMRGRSSAVPSVRIGQPTCTGDLDKAIIRRYVKRNIAKITYCYEKQLLATPTLEGTVNTRFNISNTGAVLSSSASGVDPAVSSCVAGVLKAIEFPKPADGGAVECTYPFVFRPSGG